MVRVSSCAFAVRLLPRQDGPCRSPLATRPVRAVGPGPAPRAVDVLTDPPERRELAKPCPPPCRMENRIVPVDRAQLLPGRRCPPHRRGFVGLITERDSDRVRPSTAGTTVKDTGNDSALTPVVPSSGGRRQRCANRRRTRTTPNQLPLDVRGRVGEGAAALQHMHHRAGRRGSAGRRRAHLGRRTTCCPGQARRSSEPQWPPPIRRRPPGWCR